MNEPGRDEQLLFALVALRDGRLAALDAESRAAVERGVAAEIAKYSGGASAALASLASSLLPRGVAGGSAGADTPTLTGFTPAPGGHVLLQSLDALDRESERYTLNRLHSKGGLGQVWLARDGTLGREVAFKEIRPEYDDRPDVWARFLREAQITGRLEHPGVVPVYELSRRGEGGRPFYTMRFIRGRTMREAIAAYQAKRKEGKAGPLDLSNLLNAFIGVANAVAYAHAKRVIHRDLKGDNVIVGDYGEVIVLDWGLANSLDEAEAPVAVPATPALGEGTMAGQVLGTPAYMPPEQAQGRIDQVGTASDVYSLGAILFEILTGQTPIHGGSANETVRRAATEARPSARSIDPEVPRALDAVCAKALALDPADRYASAGDLADEVRRFLADEPVAAWPEPWTRRAGRWARRHRAAVTGAAALLVTAVVALAAGNVLLGQKNREIERQRAQADANFRLAKGAVDRYLTRVADSKELRAKNLEGLRTSLFASAREFYETFVKQRAEDAGAKADLASAYVSLGNISRLTGNTKDAEASFGRAIDLYQGLPGARTGLMGAIADDALLDSETRRPKEAEAAFRRALAVYETAPESRDADYLASAANTYDNLGTMLNGLRRLDESEAAHKKSLEIRERLAKEHPESEAYRLQLLQSHTNLASLYASTGREAEAEPHLRAAAGIGEALVAAHPDDPEYRKGLSATLNNLGGVYTLTGRTADARAAHERSLAIREKLAAEHPAILEYQLYLAGSYVNLGELEVRDGQCEAALDPLEKADRVLGGVLEKEPRHTAARFYTAYAASWTARALDGLGRFPEGKRAWERAASFNDGGFPAIPAGFARALALRGRTAEAVAQAQQVEKAQGLSPDIFYELAAAYSIASARDPARREACAVRAVELLRRAAAMGLFKAPGAADAALRDRDFASIAGRPEFRKAVGG